MKKTTFFLFIIMMITIISGCGIKLVPRYPEGQIPDKTSPAEVQPDQNQKTNTSVVMNKVLYQKFLAEIKTFLGAPYVWGGASPAGTDCSGLISTLYKRAANLDLPHSTQQLSQTGRIVSVKQIKFGDLVFFNNGEGKKPTHVGFYLTKGNFVHASESEGVIISKLTDVPYRNQYLGAKRLIE
ncbi:C40 family peptidase [candidate division KSB1 bacterium]|nr:C40 family peptidase [candidate division KSB1 bacterium]